MEEQLELFGRGVDHLAVDFELVAGHIDHEFVIYHLFDLCLLVGLTEAAVDRLDAGDDLLGVKRLDHIVVRAELETEHLVKGLPFCGEHDHRNVGFLADFTADLPAVEAGQHHVEQHKIRLEGVEFNQRFLAVMREDYAVSFFL